MFGFNVPACNVLDVVSVEVEHYPNRYPNSDFCIVGQNSQFLPVPTIFPSGTSDLKVKVYPWFWSIYVKKTFLDRFALIAQFARDHMRPINNNTNYQYTEDVLERKGDWWWNVRLNVNY